MMRNRDHRRIRRWVSLDLDGGLPAERRAELEAHLGLCAECRRQRDALLAARAQFEATPRIAASAGFADRVMAALARDVLSPWLEALPLVRGLAAAGLAACVLSVSLLLVAPSGATTAEELPMGPLDRVSRLLFEKGSVPPEMLPAPRPPALPKEEGR